MMFATGPGANSRIELGTAVVFGMAMNAFIGTLFVPNFWVLMQTIQEKYLSKIIKPPKNPVHPGNAPLLPSLNNQRAKISNAISLLHSVSYSVDTM